jgi:cyclic pyranopterin phosphate synthase
VQLQETGQKIGFITPLTHNFCELQPRAPDLHRGALHVPRAGGHGRPARAAAPPDDDAMLEDAIRAAIERKPKGHDFDYSRQKVDGQVDLPAT